MISDKGFYDTTIEGNPNQIFMQEAIRLGELGRLSTPPNPWVGAVLVKNNSIVGRGTTEPPGKDHAEIVAIKEAGALANGSTLFVTLEPCCHFGRTPPCSNAIIEAGIKHVVIGIEDPDKKVAGKGIQELRKAGIEVEVGCCKEEINLSLQPYIHHRQTGRPFVICKVGMSLDGKMTDSKKASKWITSESARVRTHALRAASQAIIVGSDTFLADNPRLTVRHPPYPHTPPLRVVLDRRKRIKECDADLILEEPDLKKVLQILGAKGVLQVMLEGGGTLISSFLKEGLIDIFYTHINGRIFGGKNPFAELDTVSSTSRFTPRSCTFYGDTIEITWEKPLEQNPNMPA